MKNNLFIEHSEQHKFTVLMSVYARENHVFFRKSLESNIDNQSRKPNEFVLVCDGPLSKKLNNVIDEYIYKYPQLFKVYRLNENQGLGKALNFGLNLCSYDIVARADSDDICAFNRYEVQVGYLEKHQEISAVSSYIDEFNDDWTKPFNKKMLPLNNNDLYEFAKFRNPLNHMAVVFRKEDILNVGSYQHVPYVEDYELWVRLLINGYKIANINQFLVHARVGNGMINRRGNKAYIKSWHKLSEFMYKNKMINTIEYMRNIISIRIFIYLPISIKEKLYKTVLRKEIKD